MTGMTFLIPPPGRYVHARRRMRKVRASMVRFEGQKGVANRVKISLEPLLERARLLRRDAARLVRELGRTSEEISALRDESIESRRADSGQSIGVKMENPG